MKDKINNLIDNFIKKILQLESQDTNLQEKLDSINMLLNNLLDYCIKHKIHFYIQNKIKYNKITNIFKTHLFNYISDLIESKNDINKYLSHNNLDNYSDINSLLFNNYKKSSDDMSLLSCNNDKYIEFNYATEDNHSNHTKLALYIKILLSQDKNIIEFIDKLNNMCMLISDESLYFDITKPFE